MTTCIKCHDWYHSDCLRRTGKAGCDCGICWPEGTKHDPTDLVRSARELIQFCGGFSPNALTIPLSSVRKLTSPERVRELEAMFPGITDDTWLLFLNGTVSVWWNPEPSKSDART